METLFVLGLIACAVVWIYNVINEDGSGHTGQRRRRRGCRCRR